jgi:carboxylesterase type B
MEWGLIQHSLPEPELSISELDGLNLNITVPLLENELPNSGRKLPVVVFIHGGGYAIGSNSWPQYSLARMVKLSAVMGSPIIGVGIK